MTLSYKELEKNNKELYNKLSSCLKNYAGLCHKIEILETQIQELKDEIQKRK